MDYTSDDLNYTRCTDQASWTQVKPLIGHNNSYMYIYVPTYLASFMIQAYLHYKAVRLN